MIVQFVAVIGITAGRGLPGKQIPSRKNAARSGAAVLEFRV
jgi:hypothetical protein